MAIATLTSKGQVTIPGKLRKKLHLRAGDKIDFLLVGDNEVLLRPVTRKADEVFGCLRDATGVRHETPEGMDAAMARRWRRNKP